MKTIPLVNYILGLSLVAIVQVSFADSKATSIKQVWEVAIVFLGSQETEEVQDDIDRNMLELARTEPNEFYQLAIARDLPTKSIFYFHTTEKRMQTSPWDLLFFKSPLHGILIPGEMKQAPLHKQSLLDSPELLKNFFSNIFSNPKAKRILIIYGHGEGYQGLRLKKLIDLEKTLTATLPQRGHQPPTDILWMDSCFMGSLEVAFQLRKLTQFYLASQESEFTSGMPFESLSLLQEGPSDALAVAKNLARHFIESYSYIKNGNQAHHVQKSSATISILNTKSLNSFVKTFSQLKSSTSAEVFKQAIAKSQKAIMEKSELLDLGSLLLQLNTPEGKLLLQQMNVNNKKSLRTHPRILIQTQTPTTFVFAFENWTRGMKDDHEIHSLLPKNLTPQGFLPGPKNSLWPYRQIQKRLYVSPFMPGIATFNLILQDKLFSYTRTTDLFINEAQNTNQLILLNGYTQGVSSQAERYTGLNIANPHLGIPDIDYLDNDFYQETLWGN